MKFIKVTTDEGETVYLNSNEIRSFTRRCEGLTSIDLQYGGMIVTETPEELFKMLGGV